MEELMYCAKWANNKEKKLVFNCCGKLQQRRKDMNEDTRLYSDALRIDNFINIVQIKTA